MFLFALALAAQPIVVDVHGEGCADAEALALVINTQAGAGSVVAAGSRVVEVHYFSAAGTAKNLLAAGTAENLSAAGTTKNLSANGTAENLSAAGTAKNASAAGTAKNLSAAGTAKNLSTPNSADIGAELKFVVDGVPRGARRLGPFGDCAALQDALTLTLLLIVDPLSPPVVAVAVAAPVAPVLAPRPSAPTLAAPPRRRNDRIPLQLQAMAGVGVGSGFAPAQGASGLLRLQFEMGWLGIGVGARLDLPSLLTIDGTRRLETGAAAGVVDGCFVQALSMLQVEGCAVAEAGALRAVGIGFSRPEPVVANVITGGAALGINVPLLSGFGLSSRLLLTTPLLGARLLDRDGTLIWASPPVAVQWVVGISAEPPKL